MKKIIIPVLALLLVLAALGTYHYLQTPVPILADQETQSLEGMEVYYSQEPVPVRPAPYSAYARLIRIVSPGFNKEYLGENASYSTVYMMDETLETQLRGLLAEYEMKRTFGEGDKASSDEYPYHLECRLSGGEILHIFVGSESLPCRVEAGGRGYRILQEEAFRKAFEEYVWDYLTAQILERAWEKGRQVPLETRPMGWTMEFTKGSESVWIRLLFYRSMESGNLSVSFDGENFESVGAETVMYGVKGYTGENRSAEMNDFCEYDGEWLYISGLDLTEGNHDDCVYKVNLKNGLTVPTDLRAPALGYYDEDQPVFYHRDEE